MTPDARIAAIERDMETLARLGYSGSYGRPGLLYSMLRQERDDLRNATHPAADSQPGRQPGLSPGFPDEDRGPKLSLRVRAGALSSPLTD